MPASKNLIYFQSDNHSRLYLGCCGNPIAHTPNLDKLAARGALFKNAMRLALFAVRNGLVSPVGDIRIRPVIGIMRLFMMGKFPAG
tara:strand:+ start:129 stop:386 length:258 start_codon:yes stop_codon:yes gene_type:complete